MSLRFGLVTQLDPASHRARVRFPAEDLDTTVEEPGMESYWLPVLTQWSMGARSYCLPTVGEQVAVWLDAEAADGVILGGIYSEADAPPAAPATSRHQVYPDGTVVEYDPEAHRLKVDAQGTVQLTTTGDVTADVGGSLDATVAGDLQATVTGTAQVQAATVTLQASTSVGITAPAITLTGAVLIAGTLGTTSGGAGGGTATFSGPATFQDTVTAQSTVAATGAITTQATLDALGGVLKSGVPYNHP